MNEELGVAVYVLLGLITSGAFIAGMTISRAKTFPNQKTDLVDGMLLAIPAIAAAVFWPLVVVLATVGWLVRLLARGIEARVK